MLSRFKTPLIAIVLAIVPFFIFLGSTQTVDINGVRVTDNRFNVLGIVLALVGLWMAVRVLLPSAPRDAARKGLAGIAAVLCVVQIAASADVIRPLEWLDPHSDLPQLAYTGLDDGNRGIVEDIVARGDVEAVRRDIIVRSGSMLDQAHRHMDFAEVCHEGRYRIDYDALDAQSADLPQEDRAEIIERAEFVRRPAPEPENCTERGTAYAMGELVDDINRAYDMIAILIAGYNEMAP